MEQLFLNFSVDPTKFISYHVNSDMELEGYYQKANEIALDILSHYKHVLGMRNNPKIDKAFYDFTHITGFDTRLNIGEDWGDDGSSYAAFADFKSEPSRRWKKCIEVMRSEFPIPEWIELYDMGYLWSYDFKPILELKGIDEMKDIICDKIRNEKIDNTLHNELNQLRDTIKANDIIRRFNKRFISQDTAIHM